MISESVKERFFSKVNKTETCWLWTATTRVGYGAFRFNGGTVGAHRLSYEMHKGSIPEGLIICHTCDTPACVNPDHLIAETHKYNAKDAYDKGRIKIPEGRITFKKGHTPANRKLSDNTVKTIKNLISIGESTLKGISEVLQVSYDAVKDIACGRTYINVPAY